MVKDKEVVRMDEVKRVFLNLTAHKLTKEQIEVAKRQFGIEEFKDAEEVIPTELLKKLRQCPKDDKELYRLACELSDILVKYVRENAIDLYVHLPVGSPAFMWVFANVFPHRLISAVFSHTKRVTEEIQQSDGSVVKRSVFKFEGYTVFL